MPAEAAVKPKWLDKKTQSLMDRAIAREKALSAMLMTYILTRGTGQRMTDRRMAASRPQYADYIARTSGFIPLPPRRAAPGP